MLISDALEAHAAALREEGRHEATVRNALRAAGLFRDYLVEAQVTRVGDVRRAHVREFHGWLYALKRRQCATLSAATQKIYLSHLTGFLRWLTRERLIGMELAPLVELPRSGGRRLPRGLLTQEEVQRILAQPELSNAIGYRDRVMLEVLAATGLRIGELVTLRVDGVDLEGGYLRVMRKKSREQLVPVDQGTGCWLREYLAHVREKLAPRKGCRTLFLTRRGIAFERSGAWKRVSMHAQHAGITHPVHPRSFRHSFATEMLRHGASIRHVQELLGHASVSTTQVYTHVVIDDLKRVHGASHPRERDAALRAPVHYQGRTL